MEREPPDDIKKNITKSKFQRIKNKERLKFMELKNKKAKKLMKTMVRRLLFTITIILTSIVCIGSSADAATIKTVRTGTVKSQSLTTTVTVTYSKAELKKLKGTSSTLLTNLNDGTKLQVTLKYNANNITVTAVRVSGYSNTWKVQCNSSSKLSPSSTKKQANVPISYNSAGNAVFTFKFTNY